TAFVCSVVVFVNPIPMADLLFLAPLHIKMTFHIGKAKGFPVTQERAREVLQDVLAGLGTSVVGGVLAGLVKFVPIIGPLIYVPIVYGTTWAVGCVVESYFDGLRAGTIPTVDTMKELFQRELAKGKAKGASIRRDEIDRAYRELKAKVEER